MEQAAHAPASSITPDFGALLAALSASVRKPEPAWKDDELADDVATLSYEHALRTHARYKPSSPGEAAIQTAPSETVAPTSKPLVGAMPESQDAGRTAVSDAGDRVEHRKCASITIRLTQAECEQLKQRAAEAGLSVSAYLRSCTFEVESLRAQVKAALTEMRKAGTRGTREQGHKETTGPLIGEPERRGAAASGFLGILHPLSGLGSRLFHRNSS